MHDALHTIYFLLSSNLVTVVSLIIGLVGLLASLFGSYLAYLSFVNPIKRFNKYLAKPERWEHFTGTDSHLSVYRHKSHPAFQIEVKWDQPIVKGFSEEWINDAIYPDKTNNESYFVQMKANGMLLDTELFVSLDGHRYFVPVPKVRSSEGNERKFYYEKRQRALAAIIGKFHNNKNLAEFISNQKKPIGLMY